MPDSPEKKIASVDHSSARHNDRDLAGLAYMPVISVLVYNYKNENAFVAENAKQGTALFIMMVFGWLLSFIPLIEIFGWILILAGFVYVIMGFLQAFKNGIMVNIPWLSGYIKGRTFTQIFQEIQSVFLKNNTSQNNTSHQPEKKLNLDGMDEE